MSCCITQIYFCHVTILRAMYVMNITQIYVCHGAFQIAIYIYTGSYINCHLISFMSLKRVYGLLLRRVFGKHYNFTGTSFIKVYSKMITRVRFSTYHVILEHTRSLRHVILEHTRSLRWTRFPRVSRISLLTFY